MSGKMDWRKRDLKFKEEGSCCDFTTVAVINAMEKNYLPSERLSTLSVALCSHFSAIYLINRMDSTYEKLHADSCFESILPAVGTLRDAYKVLFAAIKTGEIDQKGIYDAFIDETLFLKDSYSGSIDIPLNDSIIRYDFRIIKLSEEEAVLFFLEDRNSIESDRIEKMKIETIQENYLFSMIVDLKSDTCRNSNTTEISAKRQDYMDLKYSQWRYMIANMFLPDDKSTFLMISEPSHIIEKLKTQKQFNYEIQMQNMQGEYIWVRLMFNRMKGFSEDFPVFVYTVQDINEDMHRLLQQENIIAAVEEKNQQLDSINKAKTVFISNMSHEIRTPINAVLGMDEMILREATDDNIRSYAYDIKNAGKMLLSIINDILDYSKIESGKMEIIPVEYQLSTLIHDVNNLISVKIKEKDLVFDLDIDPKLPSTLFGDEVRIKQVLINILTNAVKYTEKGNVTLSIRCEHTDKENANLYVKVQDTGIGMKKEDMKNLFNQFQRLDEKRNRHIEGTGLGMSIVVSLLEQMNSKLEVDSVYGQGSTFSFVLPQKVIDDTPIKDFEAAKQIQLRKKVCKPLVHAPNAHILGVDDNRVNLTILKGLLKQTNVQFDYVLSGKDCLKKIADTHYDLIFLDHLMPEMDGIETIDHIRKMGAEFENLPVIALTANVVSGAKERYMNAGFSDFLEKPIVPKKLEETLITYLPKNLLEE